MFIITIILMMTPMCFTMCVPTTLVKTLPTIVSSVKSLRSVSATLPTVSTTLSSIKTVPTVSTTLSSVKTLPTVPTALPTQTVCTEGQYTYGLINNMGQGTIDVCSGGVLVKNSDCDEPGDTKCKYIGGLPYCVA